MTTVPQQNVYHDGGSSCGGARPPPLEVFGTYLRTSKDASPSTTLLWRMCPVRACTLGCWPAQPRGAVGCLQAPAVELGSQSRGLRDGSCCLWSCHLTAGDLRAFQGLTPSPSDAHAGVVLAPDGRRGRGKVSPASWHRGWALRSQVRLLPLPGWLVFTGSALRFVDAVGLSVTHRGCSRPGLCLPPFVSTQ